MSVPFSTNIIPRCANFHASYVEKLRREASGIVSGSGTPRGSLDIDLPAMRPSPPTSDKTSDNVDIDAELDHRCRRCRGLMGIPWLTASSSHDTRHCAVVKLTLRLSYQVFLLRLERRSCFVRVPGFPATTEVRCRLLPWERFYTTSRRFSSTGLAYSTASTKIPLYHAGLCWEAPTSGRTKDNKPKVDRNV